jgi:galactose mutarotase-like enzyme
MINLENDFLKVCIKEFGAELCSVIHKEFHLEYIWQAGEEWPKHAPVLFPIVGQVLNNEYAYNGNAYTLNRHGFARESLFEVLSVSESSVSLILKSNESTLQKYPFNFEFIVSYELKNNLLVTTYDVNNKGNSELYYSVGGHPAFKVPIEERLNYDDYILEFDKPISTDIWPLDNGQISKSSLPYLSNQSFIKLTKALFENDALVFKGFPSQWIELRSDLSTHGLKFMLNDCPFLGLWAAKGADFVCIEPWWGIADSVESNNNFSSKEGIIRVEPGAQNLNSYSIIFY